MDEKQEQSCRATVCIILGSDVCKYRLLKIDLFLFFLFLRQRVINVLILHSALGAERGLRGRAAGRSDSLC